MNFENSNFCKKLGLKVPLIVAPMFLVSREDLIVAASEAGALGTFPALNYRPLEAYKEALRAIRSRTQKPIGVNVIVNKSNTRQNEDLKMALDAGVNVFITSLGSPKEIIRLAHAQGAQVFCDVTNLEHALKVQDMGADAVIAVGSGAGGHAGPISPLVLIPWLKEKLNIPIIAAGGIARGSQMAAAMALGAEAVSVGTRFIVSQESQVGPEYKNAIIKATPEDIILTSWISGTPAAIIRTQFTEKWDRDLPWILKFLKSNSYSKKIIVPLMHLLGSNKLEQAVSKPSWKSVWSAGQSAGLVHDEKSVAEIIEEFKRDYQVALDRIS